MRDDRAIDNTSDYSSDKDNMPPLEDYEEDFDNVVKGKTLVFQRALNLQAKEKDNNQRENIFHTWSFVYGTVCSLIIDEGSYSNAVSTLLVEKLGSTSTKHLNSYQLHWLNKCEEVKVTKQVIVPFSIKRYADQVCYDVMPMYAGHILFGRPWQNDKWVIHDGF